MNRFSRKDFLEALFGPYFLNHDGFIVVRSTRHMDRKLGARYFPNVEILAKEQYQPDQDVYFGVCPRESMKTNLPDIRYCIALWAGLDLTPDGYSGRESFFSGPAMAAKAVRSFPVAPSIIVESGWGMHLYWLLKDVTDIGDLKRLEEAVQRVNDYFQCKARVPADSLLRLPGTFNCKMPGRSVHCEVKYLNPDFRYDLEDFESVQFASEMLTVQSAGRGDRGLPATGAPSNDTTPSDRSRGADVEDYSHELDQFLAREAAGVQETAAPREEPRPSPRILPLEPIRASSESILKGFEPVPYEEDVAPARKASPKKTATPSEDLVADKIAERVVDKLSEKLMNQLVDEIVERLTKRLMSGRPKT